ncbi:unnamed protein product, partial [Polarella glacialis]
KSRAMCFDKLMPCGLPRSNYCNQLSAERHANGFIQSDPAFYEQWDRDYFLTAPGVYADLDGQLAARLARFFRADVAAGIERAGDRRGRPAKVLDMGCGRGSYVELLRARGLVAVGLDGDPIIQRTLPKHGLLWDLTQPLDLPWLRAEATLAARGFVLPLWGDTLNGTDSAELDLDANFDSTGPGTASAGSCAFSDSYLASDEDEDLTMHLGMQMIGSGDEHSMALLWHLCCSDFRCVAYGVAASDPPVGTLWRLHEYDRDADIDVYEGRRPSSFYPGELTLNRRITWPKARNCLQQGPAAAAVSAGPESPPVSLKQQQQQQQQQQQSPSASLKNSLGRLGPEFGSADWVLSLGVGQHIPAENQGVFLANLARHAERGIVVSWGSEPGAANPRSKAAVEQLLKPFGFEADDVAARELRLFAGLAYGGPRADLLVLRRRPGTWAPLDPWASASDFEQRGQPLQSAALAHHWVQLLQRRGPRSAGCETHRNFGIVRPGVMWIGEGCGGLFRIRRRRRRLPDANRTATEDKDALDRWEDQNLPGGFCINSNNDYKECALPGGPKQVALPTADSCVGQKEIEELKQAEFPFFALQASPRGSGDTLRQATFATKPSERHDWKFHATADHLVPTISVWRGDPRLNIIFYKFARRLNAAAPWDEQSSRRAGDRQRPVLRGAELALEWSWLWNADWRPLLQSTATVPKFRDQNQLVRLLGVFSRLGQLQGRPRPAAGKGRWRQAARLFSRAAAAAQRLAQGAPIARPVNGPVARLVAAVLPARALREAALQRWILPAAQRLVLAVIRWRSQFGRRRRPRPPRRLAKIAPKAPELRVGHRGTRPWHRNSDEGWYIYRLTACDPSV